ncbi:MAG: N-6 DNA methylase [Acidobacteriota bacterium]
MLTAARLREYTGESGALDLLRALGYPIVPVDVDPAEWRRGGVSIPWNGEARLRLISRLRRFDLFLLSGNVREETVAEFMNSYRAYNIVTKSAVIYCANQSLSIFDLSSHGTLRRLDVDLFHPTAHALDRLNLLARGEEDALPRIFDRALDREQVTREFFQRFRAAVQDVTAALGAAFPSEERVAVEGEALLLLSRLLFLCFIQEKGWLGGERRFLVDRLEQEARRGREFFAGVLLPLFFGCLNTPLSERTLAARKLGHVPYLNGGLFEPSPFEQRHPDLHLPNDLLRRVLEEVFEKFDFRIDESDAAGTHIDPEMLGRVFESLMAADERASSGSFYTPKEIVDVLTERAIVHWLGEGSAEMKLAKLQRITILDPACGSGAFLLSALGVIERLWRALGGRVPPDLRRRIIAGSLFGVDLKPEAVRLCELRLWLAIVSGSDASIETVEPLPNLDRNILQGNSLLSPTDFLGDGRMDIYRDWLVALRAQRDLLDRYRSAPFPQRPALYRLIRGNDQRLAAELLVRTIDSADRELQTACAPQRDLFGRSAVLDADRCRMLQKRVVESKAMLERVEEGTLDFFSFDIHFATVMAAGGFDVVAGNPPWVRNSRIEPRIKKMLTDRYALFRGLREGPGFHQPDLSVVFFERALQLVSPDGVIALLMPAKILNAAYAAPLRRAANGRVVALDDWSDDPRRRRWFEADTFPLGIVVGPRRRGVHSDDSATRRRDDSVVVTACGESFEMRDLDFGTEWALLPPAPAAILSRLREQHPALATVLHRKPFMGVKTGDNRGFFLEAAAIRRGFLITTDDLRIPLTAVCRAVRGRDLRRWSATISQWMLWPPRQGWRNPPRWLEKLAAARQVDPRDFRLAFVKPEHVGIKVAWKDLSRGMAAAVLPDVVHIGEQAFPLVPNQTLYCMDAVSLDEAYVLAAILNSVVAGALLVSVAERAKDAHYRYFGRTVAALPFADPASGWDRLVRLSRRAHRGAAVAEEIDALVAQLYGVTPAELEILRAFLDRRVDARPASS